MMSFRTRTILVSATMLAAAAAPVHAEWVNRVTDGIMGTRISMELFDLLVKAKEYSVITDGAFDITYASVGYMYNFPKHIRPNEEQIAKALPAVDYRHVILDPKNQTVQFSQKGVRIDLG